VAAIAFEETALTATGWLPVSGTEGRYWTHRARYGEAFFDRHEVAAIENGNGQRKPMLRRAPACRCSLPYGRLEESICWKCGRRVPL
jgi:hypothetical protein